MAEPIRDVWSDGGAREVLPVGAVPVDVTLDGHVIEDVSGLHIRPGGAGGGGDTSEFECSGDGC